MIKMKQALLALVVALSAMSVGCALLQKQPDNAKLVVTYATVKTIDNASDPAAEAARIHKVVSDVKTILSNDPAANAETIVNALRSKIFSHPRDAADTILINALLDNLQAELEKRLNDNLISPDRALTANQVLGWIDDAVTVSGY